MTHLLLTNITSLLLIDTSGRGRLQEREQTASHDLSAIAYTCIYFGCPVRGKVLGWERGVIYSISGYVSGESADVRRGVVDSE